MKYLDKSKRNYGTKGQQVFYLDESSLVLKLWLNILVTGCGRKRQVTLEK